jgi:hypothetical protein
MRMKIKAPARKIKKGISITNDCFQLISRNPSALSEIKIISDNRMISTTIFPLFFM